MQFSTLSFSSDFCAFIILAESFHVKAGFECDCFFHGYGTWRFGGSDVVSVLEVEKVEVF